MRGDVTRRAKGLLEERAHAVAPHRVSVGIHEAEGEQSKENYRGKSVGASLVEVAAAHEFGAGSVPDRSWLRTWVDQNRDRLEREMVRSMRAEYRGDAGELERQTGVWRSELRAWISEQEGHLLPVTLGTYEQKLDAGLSHPDVPMLATGQLVDAIAAELDGGRV